MHEKAIEVLRKLKARCPKVIALYSMELMAQLCITELENDMKPKEKWVVMSLCNLTFLGDYCFGPGSKAHYFPTHAAAQKAIDRLSARGMEPGQYQIVKLEL